jgi:hypothetical protein
MTEDKKQTPQLLEDAVMPSHFWTEGEFELYHKHSIYYVLWCKSHLKAYDITVQPDKHSFIKINFAIWFDHDWEKLNSVVKNHYCLLP